MPWTEYVFLIACFICFGPERMSEVVYWFLSKANTVAFLFLSDCNYVITKVFLRVFQYTYYPHQPIVLLASEILSIYSLHPRPACDVEQYLCLFQIPNVSFLSEIFLILWSMEGCIMSTCNLRIPYLHVLFQIQLFKNQEWAALTFLKLINVM